MNLEQNLSLIKYAPGFFTISILIFMGLGWFFGHLQIKRKQESKVVDSLAGAIFGLSALILGFAFSMALEHQNVRAENIRMQTIAFDNVIHSIKYLQPDDQTQIRLHLQELLDLRLNIYKDADSMTEINARTANLLKKLRHLSELIPKATAEASADNQPVIAETLTVQFRDLVNAINTDIIKIKSHPPRILMFFLYVLLSIGALLIGYTMAINSERDWFLVTLYIVLMGFGLHVIMTLEYPNMLMPTEFNKDLITLKNSLFDK